MMVFHLSTESSLLKIIFQVRPPVSKFKQNDLDLVKCHMSKYVNLFISANFATDTLL
jgi:hypothetical protein